MEPIKAIWRINNEEVLIIQFLRRQVTYSPNGHREAGDTVAICLCNESLFEVGIGDLKVINPTKIKRV